MTNADKYFRNATDEELAEWIVRYALNIIVGGQFDVAKQAWLKWLKQGVTYETD